jgi:hypothetical protein
VGVKIRKTGDDQLSRINGQGQGPVFFGQPGKDPGGFSVQADEKAPLQGLEGREVFTVTDIPLQNKIPLFHIFIMVEDLCKVNNESPDNKPDIF